MLRLSGCENFSPGTYEKQAPGLETGSLSSRDERTNHEAIGPQLYKNFFINNVRFRNQVTQMNPRCFNRIIQSSGKDQNWVNTRMNRRTEVVVRMS